MTSEKLIAYKAFDKNMKCRGFQYEVGQTYTHEGDLEMCGAGFHACENPLDMLAYYPLIGSRFAIVEYSGGVLRDKDRDSKVCGAVLTVQKEVKFTDLIGKAVNHIGSLSTVATSVNYSPAATSGDCSPAATSGDYSHAATSGDCSPAATSGDCSPAATSGAYSHAATSGDCSHAATSGYSSPAVTSGNCSHAMTSGNYSPAATSGYSSPAATYEAYSPVAALGDYGTAESSGPNSPAAALGRNAAACAGAGGGIALAEYDNSGTLIDMFASMVGQNGIEPGVWYALKNGKPVAV